MSSPLSSLKKGNRNSNLPGRIPGHRPIPFRHPEYSEDESRLLEEITTSMVASRHKARDPFTTGIPQMEASPNPSLMVGGEDDGEDDTEGALPPPGDHELIKLMMARLAIMEQKVQQQQQEIQTKDRRIKVLEDKLRIVGGARGDSNSSSQEGDNNSNNNQKRAKELEQHCLLLQQQVHEMETFLADYGMVWVGEQDDPESDIYLEDHDSEADRKQKQADAGLILEDAEQASGQSFNIDFDRLLENIQDLNVIAGEGEARVQRTTDGARLKRQEHVPITFYANGMMMFEGPFRPYTEPTAVQCVQDFLDGYFPSELQLRYPEGVPFSVRDMRDAYFKPKKASDVFSGVGNTLGGEIQPSRLIPTKLKETDATKHAKTSARSDGLSVTSDPPFPPVKVDVFLNKLPKSVVRDGKVIDIRDSVGKTLTGESSSPDKVQVAVVETAVTKTIQSALSQAKAERPKTPRDISTLRIKSETGSHTYIVKMRFKETIGDLRRYLDAHRAGETREYDICSTYPRKVFLDDQATMEASGLVPNGVLYLQGKKKN
ncbi:UBX domain-containing protein 11-like [Babylonia areolata]|uniref:UBX domain-containing protein 11-like n=1 Tax=Babylonia areolata TaxID=304850 RepID=UPI003FD12B17